MNPYDGPEFALQFPQAGSLQPAAEQRFIAGKNDRLLLTGPTTACVKNVSVQLPEGRSVSVKWQASGDNAIAIDMPLSNVASAGNVIVAIQSFGREKPELLTIPVEADQSLSQPPPPL